MKKQTLFAAILFVTSSIALGQAPVITGSNFLPTLHESFPGKTADSLSIATFSPGMPGPAQVWDLSGVNFGAGDIVTTYDTIGKPFSPEFPTANSAQHHTVFNFWYYYDGTSSYYDWVGTATQGYGYLSYSDPVRYMNFPFTYQDSISDTFEGIFMEPIGVGIRKNGVLSGYADGYGTLIVPNDTIQNTLRVHYQETYLDSNALGDTNNVYIETYMWLEPGFHYPVLIFRTQYDGGTLTGQSLLLFNEMILGIGSAPQPIPFSVFPNPTRGTTFVDFTLNNPAPVQLEVWSLTGKKLGEQSLQHPASGSQRLPLDAMETLPKGSYIVLVKQEGDLLGHKVVVKVE
ncbi:MAG: T9SS type A sorting domain-containing protein [Bacteroidia bacterium]|nr:T9SS type A sorting domain-containing protein [Bacteroidia bacterium]